MQVGWVKGQNGPCQTPRFKSWLEEEKYTKMEKKEKEEKKGKKEHLKNYMDNENIEML